MLIRRDGWGLWEADARVFLKCGCNGEWWEGNTIWLHLDMWLGVNFMACVCVNVWIVKCLCWINEAKVEVQVKSSVLTAHLGGGKYYTAWTPNLVCIAHSSDLPKLHVKLVGVAWYIGEMLFFFFSWLQRDRWEPWCHPHVYPLNVKLHPGDSYALISLSCHVYVVSYINFQCFQFVFICVCYCLCDLSLLFPVLF